MRLAWFSPMPPVPSGVAVCSAGLVASLAREHEIDVFVDEPVVRVAPGTRSAHDFVWLHRSTPYDLTVFQLGNSSHHDYLWPYLFRYPGLAVLHDAHLHHARAAALLRNRRAADYRAELAASHPAEAPDLAELAVGGFDSHLYYNWPMTSLIVRASRMTVVHAAQLATAINDEIPGAGVEAVHLSHGELLTDAQVLEQRIRLRAARRIRADAVLFGVFGTLTPEKRLPQVLAAFQALRPYSPNAHLLLAGAEAAHYDVRADVRGRGLEKDVTFTGRLDTDAELTACIAACDVSINLRWPTAREMSGPWLQALAAGRATVIMDLAHLADVPSLDPRTWTPRPAGRGRPETIGGVRADAPDRERDPGSAAPVPDAPVCVALDIMDEDHSLRLAMRRLAADAGLRTALGSAGRRYWEREHSITRMLGDYRRAIASAAARPAPTVVLPSHLVSDGDRVLERVLDEMGVTPDIWKDLSRATPARGRL